MELSFTRSIPLVLASFAVFALTGCEREEWVPPALSDKDNDGFDTRVDCDDSDSSVFPHAEEVCDGIDNNCDGKLGPDEVDFDGDGQWVCAGDCNDANPIVGLGFFEWCDGIDNDCSGKIHIREFDLDFDGFRPCGGDCNDTIPEVFPGADEACDGLDNNCDGYISDDESDFDQDTHFACGGDCDDHDPLTYPLAPEICDAVDNDCDGELPLEEIDQDEDGFLSCDGDCNDENAEVHPQALEICNDNVDDDCDPATDELNDSDNDGFSICDGDCNDQDWALNLLDADQDGASTCDGDCDDADSALNLLDNDFDGFSTCDNDCDDEDPGLNPGDVDQDGFSTCSGDCDDTTELAFPGFQEICNDSIDNDCDGIVADGPGCQITSVGIAETKMYGNDEYDFAGSAVDFGGDINDDGYGDLLVGAPGSSWEGFYQWQGAAYLLLGPIEGVFNLEEQSTVILGEADSDELGNDVEFLGDVDSDGRSDFAVGAQFSNAGGQDSGAVYVFYDIPEGITSAGAADATLWGDSAGAITGHVIEDAGDIDGDGFYDFYVGAPAHEQVGQYQGAGTVYLVNGPVYGTGNIGAYSSAVLTGENAEQQNQSLFGDNAGYSISASGDVNNDGSKDVLIGAPCHEDGGASAGAAYLVLGPATASMSLASAYAKITGENIGGFAGWSVMIAGDVDGDGNDDILVGEPADSTVADSAGSAYLITDLVNGHQSLGAAEVHFFGSTEWGRAGNIVNTIDANGDDILDILVGSYYDSLAGLAAGSVYLVDGSSLSSQVDLASDARSIVGENSADNLGFSASVGMGNYDLEDIVLVLGASTESSNASFSGAVYSLRSMDF